MIRNSNLSVLSIYMILWAHMQHTNYATLVCTEFYFRPDFAEELSLISYGWVKPRNSIDHWFTFTIWIQQTQAINSFDAIL